MIIDSSAIHNKLIIIICKENNRVDLIAQENKWAKRIAKLDKA